MFVGDIQGLAAVRAALEDQLAALDPGALLPADAALVLAEATKIERLGHAAKLAVAPIVAASEVWRGAGDRTKEEWLARIAGTTVGEATGIFETGTALTELPVVAEAVRAGSLSPVQAREIAGAAAVAPTEQTRLLEQASRSSVKELKEACKRTRAAADTDPEATQARIHKDRAATKHDNADGSATITLTGTVDVIGRMWTRAQHRAAEEFKQAHREGRREPERAYLFDAFHHRMTVGGDGKPMPVGADAKIIYRLDWDAHVRGRAEGSERCELLGYGPVPVSVVQEAAREAFITAVVNDGEDVRLVAHLGRKPTVRQVTALQARVPTCVVEGCDRTVRLEIHHVLDWAKTELTVLDFLEPTCSHHHDLITNEGYGLGDRNEHHRRPLVPPPPERAGAPPPSAGRYGVDPQMVEQIKEHIRALEDERQRVTVPPVRPDDPPRLDHG